MRIYCNFASSVDGKIGPPDRSHVPLGSAEDQRRMSVLRRQADAILIGGATFRSWPGPLIEDPAHLVAPSPRRTPLWNVVLSRGLDLPLDAPAFADPRVRSLIVTEGDRPPSHPLRERAEVVALPRVTPEAVVELLRGRGVETLLVEAGGDVAATFFHAGLMSEVYLTVAPIVLGGRDAPTMVQGAAFAFASAPRLSLLEATVKGDELFLHYRVGV